MFQCYKSCAFVISLHTPIVILSHTFADPGFLTLICDRKSYDYSLEIILGSPEKRFVGSKEVKHNESNSNGLSSVMLNFGLFAQVIKSNTALST